MKMISRILLLFCMLILGLGVGSALFSSAFNKSIPYEFQATYEDVSREQMIKQADIIFVGQVISISPARWNQDNGEYWRDDKSISMPFHEIRVRIIQPIKTKIRLDNEVLLTVLGGSPNGSIQSANIRIADKPEHNLKERDRAIFFVVKRELAWRGSSEAQLVTKPIFRFMGWPKLGYMLGQADGLYHSLDPNEPPTTIDALATKARQ